MDCVPFMYLYWNLCPCHVTLTPIFNFTLVLFIVPFELQFNYIYRVYLKVWHYIHGVNCSFFLRTSVSILFINETLSHSYNPLHITIKNCHLSRIYFEFGQLLAQDCSEVWTFVQSSLDIFTFTFCFCF